ncbi:hypothetical protein [Sulfitobacter sediminilitoris]|nr:hypothetical protein [Sulfitobacter sediminilitoris]
MPEVNSKRFSVCDLETAIYDYLLQYNTKPKPFTWTKTAQDIRV